MWTAVLLAGVGTLMAERLAPRFGSALPLRVALLGTALTVPVATLAPNVAVFAVAALVLTFTVRNGGKDDERART